MAHFGVRRAKQVTAPLLSTPLPTMSGRGQQYVLLGLVIYFAQVLSFCPDAFLFAHMPSYFAHMPSYFQVCPALFIAPTRQWPKVYDLCHTFLHVTLARKHTDMQELQAKRVQFSHSKCVQFLMPMCFLEMRAILTCPCVFWLAQHTKTCNKI